MYTIDVLEYMIGVEYVVQSYTYMYMYIVMSIVYSDGYCTGWRRPIGCLKLQVIVRKKATKI